MVVLSLSMQQKYFFAREGEGGANLSFPGRSHVGLLFTSEEQKKVGPCFRDFETSSFPPKKPKLNHKSTDKLL